MITNSTRLFAAGKGAAVLLALIAASGLLPEANAQPTIISTVPTNFATSVSPTAPVIFTFSTAMDTNLTSAQFLDISSPFTPLPATASWNSDKTRLTNTPSPPFPANKAIVWSVDGFDLASNPLATSFGSFTTGSGGGGYGSGTNEITTFRVGRINYYDQTNAGAPFLAADISFGFLANTTLASNRTAQSISLTLPTAAMDNLNESPTNPEMFDFYDYSTNQAPFDAQYPGGNYLFNVQAATSNQQVTLNLPAVSAQPPAPHVSNFAAAQSVDPTKPFTLSWDAYAGGTSADSIGVNIDTNFMTADLSTTGALRGTATSIVIPANTLPPSRFLDRCEVTFYRYVASSNSSYASFAFRATSTRFFLTTTSGATTTPLVLTNAARSANGVFSFEVTSAAGQTITIEYSTTLKPGSWSPLSTTNSPGGRVKITDSQSNPYRYYRARTGS